MKQTFFWFRRDLRLDDNVGLTAALNSSNPVQPVFILDKNILDDLDESDPRLSFIYDQLQNLNSEMNKYGSSLMVIHDTPLNAWKHIVEEFNVAEVYTNEDYEPYAIKRDKEISEYLAKHDITFKAYKDQVIFAKDDILKDNGEPYTVYTPYKNKWLANFNEDLLNLKEANFKNLAQSSHKIKALEDYGFKRSKIEVPDFRREKLKNYADERDIPSKSTTRIGPHLRFGTIGVRSLIKSLEKKDAVYISELIWREFFMMILYHFPRVVNHNFKPQYDGVQWRNNREDFEKWCAGETGYPMVDAGMRELNETGFMHNRVRMVVASFLCKHLLIDWKWGEAYFAEKLLDYELSANNGNWQWAAGTGCDAAPYFRIFNPSSQVKKFDPDLKYIKKWVPELNELSYPAPMVEHKQARERALDAYKSGLA